MYIQIQIVATFHFIHPVFTLTLFVANSLAQEINKS